ncbi:MAG: ATP-binding protein [Bacteroidales bacterium]|jgi:predicted AAA+ superfamily ATPase|nr:ATP-binding protein [Bacteroidales bacterium]
MERAIIQQNSHWKGENYSQVFDRPLLDKLIEKLELKEIQVLLGIRRSGKSSFFRMLINYLIKHEDPGSILFINCEDPFFSEIWNDASKLHIIVELAEKITAVPVKYLFLDEIQVINNWEKYVKSVYEAGKFKKIFITGSNYDLLEGNYINMLSGRYLSDVIYPLSFSEQLIHSGIKSSVDIISENPTILRLLDNSLYYGSFPEIFKTKKNEHKRQILLNYYETIVLKDCLLNNNIRDAILFRNLANYLLTNSASVFSYNSLAKALDSNENTMKQYLQILEKSYIIKELQHFSYSLKSQTKTKKKAYCIDNGLINAISLRFSSDYGKLLENLVFVEILKLNKFEIFFHNETEECDFILKNRKKLIAVQVAYELNDKTEKREFKGLEAVKKKYGTFRSFIVTYNQNFEKNGVRIMSFGRFINELKYMK